MPIDPKHIITLNQNQYPLYAGILSEAHEKGLQSIETTLLQIPSEENGFTAIVKAVVLTKDGQMFQDYGDASPKNCSPRVATALIRMASTRAKGRALRDAVNIGQTMLEELPDLEETPDGEPHGDRPQSGRRGERRSHPVGEANGKGGPGSGDGLVPCAHRGCASRIPKSRAHQTTEAWGAPYCAAHEALLESAQRGREAMRQAEDRKAQAPPEDAKTAPHVCTGFGCGKAITRGQAEVSTHRFGAPLCPSCQKGAVSKAAAEVQA
jgi:hypothetical protein